MPINSIRNRQTTLYQNIQTSIPLQSIKASSVYYYNPHKPIWNWLIIFSLQLVKAFFLFITLLVFYQTNNNQSNAFLFSYRGFISNHSQIYRICQILSIISKVLLLGSLILSRKKYESLGVLYTICVTFIHYFHILCELDLYSTTCSLLYNFLQNLPIFIISAIITLFYNIYLQNYSNRKEAVYLCSANSNFIFRCITLIILFSNAVLMELSIKTLTCLINVLLCLTLLFWFGNSGHRLYMNKISKNSLIIVITVYSSINVLFFKKLIMGDQLFSLNQIASFVVTVIIVGTLLLLANKYLANVIIKKSKGQTHAKEVDIYLSLLLENAFLNKDEDSLLLGLLNLHEAASCSNSLCSIWKVHAYDPIADKSFRLLQEEREKQSSIRFYIRCYYLRALVFNKRSKQILINYCEFILNQFCYYFQLCKIFQQLQNMDLNEFQRVKLLKMKTQLKEQSDLINQQIYQGQLQLESVIEAELQFQNVCTDVGKISRKSLQIWNIIKQQQVSMLTLRTRLAQNLQLIESTDAKWKNLGKYFKIQKQWYFIYLNYIFFIKNQKLKQKQLTKCQYKLQSIYYIKQEQEIIDFEPQQIFNSSILFSESVFYIKAFVEQHQMIISKVSKYFVNITKFTETQIIGSSLNVLLADELKAIHDQKVRQWLQLGKTSSQHSYVVRFTECLTKNGKILPLIKYYKVCVNLFSQHMLQFVALLRLKQKQQQLTSDKFDQISKFMGADPLEQNQQTIYQMSLKKQNNIFLKESHLGANEQNQDILQTKKILRFLTALLLILISCSYYTNIIEKEHLKSTSEQYLNFLNMYRFPMALVKNYMKYFLNVGNQTKVMNQIGSATKSFQGFASAPLTLQTLFDVSLNVPNYYSPHKNNSVNKGMSYDQIDLFYLIASSISSLNKFPINRTGYDFIQLNEYIKPGYDNIINGTKMNFHVTLQGIFSQMQLTQIIIGVIEILTFVMVTVVIYVKIFAYYRKMKQVLTIIIELNSAQTIKIYEYWRSVALHFQLLTFNKKINNNKKLAKFSKTINKTLKKINFDQNKLQGVNMNKKIKKIEESNQQTKKTKGIIFAIIVSMLILFCTVISIEVISYTMITSLSNFQKSGYYFLQYFPATSILGHAILQKYYSYVYPKEVKYDPDRFADALEDMRIIGQFQFIGEIQDLNSLYFKKQKVYMFGSACEFGSDVLIAAETTLAKCMTMSNKTFTTGVTSFVRMGYRQVSDYIYQKNNLTLAQLDELSTSLTMTAYFIADAITTWSYEFADKMAAFQKVNKVLSLIIGCLVVLLHLVVCQWLMFKGLQKHYGFIGNIFNSMIPEYILIQDKVMRQKFVMEGIINRQ